MATAGQAVEHRLEDPGFRNWIKAVICLNIFKEGIARYFMDRSCNLTHKDMIAGTQVSTVAMATCQVCVSKGISICQDIRERRQDLLHCEEMSCSEDELMQLVDMLAQVLEDEQHVHSNVQGYGSLATIREVSMNTEEPTVPHTHTTLLQTLQDIHSRRHVIKKTKEEKSEAMIHKQQVLKNISDTIRQLMDLVDSEDSSSSDSDEMPSRYYYTGMGKRKKKSLETRMEEIEDKMREIKYADRYKVNVMATELGDIRKKMSKMERLTKTTQKRMEVLEHKANAYIAANSGQYYGNGKVQDWMFGDKPTASLPGDNDLPNLELDIYQFSSFISDEERERVVMQFKSDLMEMLQRNHSYTPISSFSNELNFSMKDVFANTVLDEDMKLSRNGGFLHKRFKKKNMHLDSYHGVFYRGEQRLMSIYVVGEAGSGKTVFLNHMVNTWVRAHQKLKRGHTDDFDRNEATMAEFPFLFYVPLRHMEKADGVNSAILKCTAGIRNSETVFRYLMEKVPGDIIVLLDGVDELGSQIFIPPYHRYAVVASCRPWLFSILNNNGLQVDRVVLTKYLDGRDVSHNIALRSYFGTFHGLSTEEIRNLTEIGGSLIGIPFILECLQHLRLQHNTMPTTTTATMLEIIHLTLQKGDEKLRNFKPPDYIKQMFDIRPIHCFPNRTVFDTYAQFLIRVAQIAFDNVVGPLREEKLDLRDAVMHKYFKKDAYFHVCCELGVIYKVEVAHFIYKTNQLSFPHDLVEDFFAALWIVNSGSAITKFCKYCCSIERVLEQGNVFTFVCGLNPVIGTRLSKHVMEMCSTQPEVVEYRTEMHSEHKEVLRRLTDLLIRCTGEMKTFEGEKSTGMTITMITEESGESVPVNANIENRCTGTQAITGAESKEGKTVERTELMEMNSIEDEGLAEMMVIEEVESSVKKITNGKASVEKKTGTDGDPTGLKTTEDECGVFATDICILDPADWEAVGRLVQFNAKRLKTVDVEQTSTDCSYGVNTFLDHLKGVNTLHRFGYHSWSMTDVGTGIGSEINGILDANRDLKLVHLCFIQRGPLADLCAFPLSHLQHLSLHNFPTDGHFLQQLGEVIAQGNFRSLLLSGANIGVDFHPDMSPLVCLSHFAMKHIAMFWPSWFMLVQSLNTLNHLQTLSLQNNAVMADGAGDQAGGLLGAIQINFMPQLRSLELSGEPHRDGTSQNTMNQIILRQLHTSVQLVKLELSNISNLSSTNIATAIPSLQHLEQLRLKCINFQSKQFSLKSNIALQTVDFVQIEMTTKAWKHLFHSTHDLENLSELCCLCINASEKDIGHVPPYMIIIMKGFDAQGKLSIRCKRGSYLDLKDPEEGYSSDKSW